MRTSQSVARPRRPPGPRRGVHPARRPALRRGPHAPPDRRPRRPAEPRGAASPIRSSASSAPSGSRRRVPPQVDDSHRARRPRPRPELEFFNGLGGFAEGGREYVTILGPGQSTPAPWLNVIANPSFGFQVSESGSGYTWSGNSRENQLTPWSNDPVSDPVSEAIYVRDDDTRRAVGPDGPADPLRGVDVRRPSRRRLQPVRAPPRRHPARPGPVRPARRPA